MERLFGNDRFVMYRSIEADGRFKFVDLRTANFSFSMTDSLNPRAFYRDNEEVY